MPENYDGPERRARDPIQQQIEQLGDEVVVKDVGNLSVVFDPAAVIDLVDPATGLPTGQTMTHGDVYVALHSLYLQLATERDAAQGQA